MVKDLTIIMRFSVNPVVGSFLESIIINTEICFRKLDIKIINAFPLVEEII